MNHTSDESGSFQPYSSAPADERSHRADLCEFDQKPGISSDSTRSFEGEGSSRSARPAPPVPADLIEHPRYEILELVGLGGMGAVYKARHRLMDRIVALKVINPALVEHAETVPRFRREMRAAARLCHPNIVTAYDADQAGATHFLVMEFVQGRNVAETLKEQGQLPPELACDYARQAARGLQHAHEQQMVHRDIKPHNLMVTPSGLVKILDFGLARFASEVGLWSDAAAPAEHPLFAESHSREAMAREASLETHAPWLTPLNTLVGTTDYTAPEERAPTHRADIRADIYSLGCTLYRMLAGHVPFPGGSYDEKVRRHREELPRPLRALRPDVSEKLALAVERMMAKDPADRFQTPADLAAALELCAPSTITHIMVVDDDADARATMAKLLGLQDVFVTTAENGRDALAKLREGPLPSLILLDMRMPVMDGWQFLQERQRDAALARVPVILMSGAHLEQDGIADYLQKPFRVEDLTAKIHDYVR